MLRSARKHARETKRGIEWSWHFLRSWNAFRRFRCNICGRTTSFPPDKLSRELWSCVYCGSNVRWRSVIHALSTELFGRSLAIADFPKRPDIVGIGLSDWDGYANRLADKLGYINTFYHQEPFLDITSLPASRYGSYDFIISSDVFEHVSPPISKAFENARHLLKPNGVMILTVPYLEGRTKEHFPELHEFSIEKKRGTWTLVSQTVDGRKQEFANVTFHGGPGTVVEMRLFGKRDLYQTARDAGFQSIRVYDEENIAAGIRWIPYVPEEAPYRPYIYGLDTPPWALRMTDSMSNNESHK